MAEAAQEVEIRLKVTGNRDVEQSFKKTLDAIDSAAEQSERKADDRQGRRETRDGGRRERGPLGFLGTAGAVAAGTFAGRLLGGAFSASRQALVSAFEPNITAQERGLAVGEAGFSGIPGVGELLAAQFRAENQVSVGTAQGTNQRLNQFLQGLGAISALQNRELSRERGPEGQPSDLEQAIRDDLRRFTDQLGELTEQFSLEEFGREIAASVAAARASEATAGVAGTGTIDDLAKRAEDAARTQRQTVDILRQIRDALTRRRSNPALEGAEK